LYSAAVRALDRLLPFHSPEARRFALLFAIVYFAQGMWYLPNQAITIALKERGLGAQQVGEFFTIATIPWLLKPVYGLVSDFVPLFGRRRTSYFLLTTALAAGFGFALAMLPEYTYWWMVGLFTAMGFGLAFTDVLTDALMVETGKPRGLTGAFQGIQWAAIYGASIVVGVLGGHFAEQRDLSGAFLVAATCPLLSLAAVATLVREPATPVDRAQIRETWRAVRSGLGQRTVWLVAGFIFFFAFSPSFGPALIYYQTDVLGFSQQFIGHLTALGSIGAMAGALLYAPLSRRVPLRRLIYWVVGLVVLGTLAYLRYADATSAMVIDPLYGVVYMLGQLAMLDLAAKVCPRRIEATFFALLMSVFNGGAQGSQVVGGFLYDTLGYTPLILISAAASALVWPLIPLVRVDEIEVQARAAPDETTGAA
jgi:MFS family permease